MSYNYSFIDYGDDGTTIHTDICLRNTHGAVSDLFVGMNNILANVYLAHCNTLSLLSSC